MAKRQSNAREKLFEIIGTIFMGACLLSGLIFLVTLLGNVELYVRICWLILAFGFFIGYGLHLFVDSFTIDGIQPFYPAKRKISGKLRVGRITETGIFVFFVFADVVLLIIRILSIS